MPKSCCVVGCSNNKEKSRAITGSASFLARDVLDLIKDVPRIAQMPASHHFQHKAVISECKEGLAKFAGLEGFLIFATVQDNIQRQQSGYNANKSVAVWNKSGKQSVDVEGYCSLMEAVKPDMYQALCDSDTPRDASKKRIRKSNDRTLNFLDKILERTHKSEVLKDVDLFGVVEGGYNADSRAHSAKETAKRRVAGFSIEGFSDDVPLNVLQLEPLLKSTIEHLPSDKPRHLPGVMDPISILAAVELGIDLFDSSYACAACENGAALVFQYDTEDHRSSDSTKNKFELSLKDGREDFGPLLEGCSCHTCTNHSRAYITHLLETSEILASVLLMIHNFHHYFGFLRAIASSLERGTFSELKQLILSQR